MGSESKADNASRIAATNRSLYPRRLDAIVACVGYGNYLAEAIDHNRGLVDSLTVVTTSKDKRTQRAAKNTRGVRLVICDDHRNGGDSFNKGNLLNAAVLDRKPKDWVLFFDADIILPHGLREWFKDRVLNPGMLYFTSRYHSNSEKQTRRLLACPELIQELQIRSPGADRFPWGYFQLWNVNAQSIRDCMPDPVGRMWPTAGSVDNHFMRQWPKEKRIRIDLGSDRSLSCVHIWHGDWTAGWHGGINVGKDKWWFHGQTDHPHRGMYYFGEGNPPSPNRWIKLARTDTGDQVVFWWQDGDPEVKIDRQMAKYKGFGFFSGRCVWNSQPIETVQVDVYSIENLPEKDRALIIGDRK
jgi:hypothetical protein